MIRIAIQSNTRQLDGYAAYLAHARQANIDTLKLTIQKNTNKYLRPMEAIDPGPSQHGGGAGDWSTDPTANRRAQRWWWANVRAGTVNANPTTGAYIRTGGMGRRWKFVTRGNRTSLENTSAGASYTLSMARIPRARGGRPNPGHIRTGWPQVTRATALAVMEMVIDDVQLAQSKTIAASVASGSYKVVIP
jgi:hypothetical protein